MPVSALAIKPLDISTTKICKSNDLGLLFHFFFFVTATCFVAFQRSLPLHLLTVCPAQFDVNVDSYALLQWPLSTLERYKHPLDFGANRMSAKRQKKRRI
jgi:hypothetical protein